MATFIYVIGWRDLGRYKIGLSTKPARRIKQIDYVSPQAVEVILIREAINCRKLERALHKQFRAQRLRYEWFSLSPGDIDLITHTISEWTGKEIQPPREILPEVTNAAAALGRIGGSAKTERKQAASRNNGRLGGRPKKTAVDNMSLSAFVN